jgi:hypothetical protein
MRELITGTPLAEVSSRLTAPPLVDLEGRVWPGETTSGLLDTLEDIAGKVWAAPATLVGAIIGFAAVAFDGADVEIGHNAIEFSDFPLGPNGSAMTLGNVILYVGSAKPDSTGSPYGSIVDLQVGLHEEAHTYQYQALGPFFPLFYGLSWLSGGVSEFEWQANNYAAGANIYSRSWPYGP